MVSVATVASMLFIFSGAVRCAMNFCVLSLSHRSPALFTTRTKYLRKYPVGDLPSAMRDIQTYCCFNKSLDCLSVEQQNLCSRRDISRADLASSENALRIDFSGEISSRGAELV